MSDTLEQPLPPWVVTGPSTTTTFSEPYHYPTNIVVVAQPTIFDLVKRDLDARDRIGAAQHNGKPLLAGNGKDWLREAYDEALDLCVYLRGALAERDAESPKRHIRPDMPLPTEEE
jgi:hypothetical protein